MQIDVVTLFPKMFEGPLDWSIMKRAQDKGVVTIKLHDLRQWATNKYKSVDDRPYGGGAGMIMRVDIIDSAISNIKYQMPNAKSKVVLLDAGGEKYTQKKAKELTQNDNLIIICGHYEGVDHRVHKNIADEVISVGDYVLSGGEIPAIVIVDSVVRLLPGVLGNEKSLDEESHNDESMEYPQYTRPDEYKGWKVPEILLSGDHKKIKEWRKP